MTAPSTPPAQSKMHYLAIVARGFCMGAADIVPGVSGGKMAFILGIYHELLDAIKAVDARFFRLLLTLRLKDAISHIPWRFLLSLGTGIIAAILTLAHFLETQLDQNPTRVWAFFFGLVLASVITVSRTITKWNIKLISAVLIALVSTYLLLGVTSVNTPETPSFLLISGALAITAMILPGISGAYVLVLLGKYRYILSAVNNRDLFTLALVFAGALIGLATFSRILSWLFKRYHNATVATLTGLMLGALRRIWPWKDPNSISSPVLPNHLNSEVAISIGLCVVGLSIVFLVTSLTSRKPPSNRF